VHFPHPLEGQNHFATRRHRPPSEAGAAPRRHDRHVVRCADLNDLRDFVGGSREYDCGRRRLENARPVTTIHQKVRGLSRQKITWERACDGIEKRRGRAHVGYLFSRARDP
jgi:hypothetical protein